MSTNYANLTKEQLIQKLSLYERSGKISNATVLNKASLGLSPRKASKKKEKQFDFTKTVARKVAFRLSYLGTGYHGFSGTLKDMENGLSTIEGELFKALMTCRLIPEPDLCEWSKAGRTDKGVSGFGQVVSLWVRTKLPKDHPHTLDWESIKNLKAERSSAESWSLESEKSKSNQTENIQFDEDDEYPYLELLNRLLPNEIRILAWAPVPTAFDARFSCKWRKYKYFFRSANLDVTKMQQAAQLFIGTHDCRYICKIDPSKSSAPNFFRRDIYESSIETTSNPAFSVFIVKGRAFLWHQVRNMMALLFMVGQGMEEPSIITKMLNPSDDAGKPNYEMAPDAPLVLMECGYENLNWKTRDLSSNKNSGRTLKVIDEQWTESSLRVLQLDTLREEYLQLASGAESEEIIVFSKLTKPHISLLKRSRADSAQQVSEKRANKARRNE